MQKHFLFLSFFLLYLFTDLKAGDHAPPVSLSGTYLVGSSQSVYKKLTDVATALNNASNTVTGNVVFELDSDYDGTTGETFPITFNQISNPGNWTVTIRPKAGVSLRTTSGDPGNGNSVIFLNRADRLIFDGRPGGSGTTIGWLIRNTRTTSIIGPAIQLINDAQYNTMTWLQLEGQAATNGNGIVALGGSNTSVSAGEGNDNNTISYCTIRDRTDVTGYPGYGIVSAGSGSDTARFNSGNTIVYNNIINCYQRGTLSAGIYLYASTTRTLIAHNSFYQTQAFTGTIDNATEVKAVYINEPAFANTIIRDNFMGGSAPECGGDPFTMSGPYISYAGVEIASGSYSAFSTGNIISNNTIRNFQLTSSSTQFGGQLFRPIRVMNGRVDIKDNTIGSSTANDDIKLTLSDGPSNFGSTGIYVTSPAGINITGNKIGGFTFATGTGITNSGSFTGIYMSLTPASPFTYTIHNNLVGSTTMTDNIRGGSATSPFGFSGITGEVFSATSTVSIKNNTIAGVSMAYDGTSAVLTRVLSLNGQAIGVVDSNLISDISSASRGVSDATNTLGASGVIVVASATSPVISNNIVRRVRLTGTAATTSSSSSMYNYVFGINMLSVTSGTAQIYNNKLYDLTSSNSLTPAATLVTGMHIQVNASIYNNLVALDNGANTNDCRISGIQVNSSSATVNIFHNTFYIGGSNGNASNTAVSAVINRMSSSGSTVYLRNNILVNARSGGNGSHYIFRNYISTPATNWPVTASDYNLLVMANQAKTAWWGSGSGTELDSTQWKTTGGDAHSSFYTTAQVAPADLFTDVATGDLSIKAGATQYVAEKGTSGTGITTDYLGETRSTTAPTVGAYEHTGGSGPGGGTNTAPVITSDGGAPNVNMTLPENSTAVTTVTAIDADAGNTITYTLVADLDYALFTIDPVTGVLSFVNPPDFEQPADDDGNNVYFVIVQASDGALTAEQRFKIKITNTNDHAPVITSYNGDAAVSLRVAENTTAVGTVTATDADKNTTITYSLVNEEDVAKFAVNSSTGVLTFITAPDFEQPGDLNSDNVYVVTVKASDGDSSATQRFKIKLTDANDNAPVITSHFGAANVSLQFTENTTTVTTITATDADAGTTLAYSIVPGEDGALFFVDASTGELRFAAMPDFEYPADGNSDNVYTVSVKASDGSLSALQSFSIVIVDTNDNPPVATMTLSIPENTVEVTTLEGTDEDAGTIVTFNILNQEDGALFRINPATGGLEFMTAPDFENPSDANGDNVYVVSIKMFDGTAVTILRFRIGITDADGAAARSSHVAGRMSVAPASAEETIIRAAIKVYPNPVTGKRFTLRMDSIATGRYNLQVYTATGQVVHRQQLDHAGKSVLYPVQLPAGLARGIYTLVVKGTGMEFAGKLVIE